ncbi:MAG: exosortase-associated protein EpsI, B-type [Aquabacterium sp.]
MSYTLSKGKTPLIQIALCIALLGGAHVSAVVAKPDQYWADVIKGPTYESIIPEQFGDWVHVPDQNRGVVNPVQEEELMKLYTETVAKLYVHKPTGRALMLSIAYGRDQSTDVQIHTPEECYPSQGFKVKSRALHDVQTDYGPIKAVRMETTLGVQRKEPLTYFIRVGDSVVRGSKERNLSRLEMALQGYLVDGMLFRVSEITTDSSSSFKLQDKFIKDLMNSVGSESRKRLVGSKSSDT